MPRRLLAAAAAGALLLGLAACGDGEEGAVTTAPPSVSVSAPSDGGGDPAPSDGGGTGTDDPTAAAPDIPPPDPADYAGMDERTPEGAEQAFRYYIAVTYWGHQSGSAELLRELHGPTCIECENLATSIESVAESDNFWSDANITDYGIKSYDSENYELEIGYIYIVSEHRQGDGGPGATLKPEQAYTAIGGLDWIDGRWLVGGMEIEETESEL